MSAVRRRVVVTGRVHGVFFRESARRAARERGVTGWVTNRDDGAVEAVFEGPAEDVDALVTWMRDGPEYARVASVQVSQECPEGESDFRVR